MRGIHDEAAQVFVGEIDRGTHRRAEGFARRFAIRRGVIEKPGQRLHGVVLRPANRHRAVVQRLRHRTTQQDGRLAEVQVFDRIHIRGAKDLIHPTQHGMLQIRGLEHTARAFLLVRAVMRHPLFAEDFEAELAPFEVPRLRPAAEGMRGRAEADHRLAGVQELREMRQMIVWELTEARADDHEVRIAEEFGAADVLLVVRVDVARLFVRGEQHDAVEAMLLGQNLRQHRHRLLRAVFLIAGHEHDFLATTGSARIRGDFEVFLRGRDRAKEGEGE
jgi:hypothetical protein